MSSYSPAVGVCLSSLCDPSLPRCAPLLATRSATAVAFSVSLLIRFLLLPPLLAPRLLPTILLVLLLPLSVVPLDLFLSAPPRYPHQVVLLRQLSSALRHNLSASLPLLRFLLSLPALAPQPIVSSSSVLAHKTSCHLVLVAPL